MRFQLSSPANHSIPCPKCGIDNDPSADTCAQCGARLVRGVYEASVSSGLKRLESEKLAFLGSGVLISKFNPNDVEKYAQTQADNTLDPQLIDAIEVDSKAELGMDNSPNTMQDIRPDDIRLDSSERMDTDSHTIVDVGSFPSKTIQDFDGMSEIGALVANEFDELNESQRSSSSSTLFSATTTVPDIVTQMVEDADIHEDAPNDDASDEDEDQTKANDAVSAVEHAADEQPQSPKSSVPEFIDKEKASRYAQILIPAVHEPHESGESSRDIPAIDKLKNQGLFEPLSVHAEVSNSIEEIQNLDQLLPKSEIEPWKGSFEDSDHPRDAADEPEEDSTQPYEADKQYMPADDFTEADQDNAAPETSVEDAAVPRDSLCAIDAEAIIDNEDRVPTNQGSVVIDAPDEVDSDDMNMSIDLESCQTIPIAVEKYLPPEVLAAAHANASDASLPAAHKSRSKHFERLFLTIWVVLLVCICFGIIVLLYHMGMLARISPMLDPYKDEDAQPFAEIQGAPAPVEEPADNKTGIAIGEAAQIVYQKFDFESWIEPWVEKKIAEPLPPEAKLEYLQIGMDYYPENVDFVLRYAQSLIDAGQAHEARSFIQRLSDEQFNAPQFQELYYQAFASDPEFLPEVQEITDTDFDELAPLGGGSTITLKVVKGGQPFAAFKPLQTRRQSNYRAEIAAWRLCELLQCDFQVPWNRPIKIERNVFNKLYNRSKSKKRELYRKELKDLIWTKEGKNSYVYGTLKDWVPDFTRFPIEFTAMWKGWVSQAKYIEDFPDLGVAMQSLSKRKNTAKLYTELMAQSPNLTTEALASQVSQVLTFDYLVGNWDRFSGVPEWWGVNCQFKNNHIVSIDNGAAFPAYSNAKVQERFMVTERFSEHFIHALRTLNKEKTLEFLFPNATQFEKSSFDQFWKQRSAVLSRVDALCEKYGAEHVLSFY